MDQISKITSRDNDQVKLARRVRDGREPGLMFLEGRRLIEEAARSGITADLVFVTREAAESGMLAGLSAKSTFEVPPSVLESIADTNTPQGIVVLARPPETGPDRIVAASKTSATPLAVFLDRINNPSNLGAVVRTTEAAGAAGIVISSGSANVFSAKALRAAMGSSLRLPIWTGVSLDEAMEWAGANGMRTVATDTDATRLYTDVDWTVPRMLIIGSEAHGIGKDDLEKINERIVIPMNEKVESLNLAVATGVILFEARRQNAG